MTKAETGTRQVAVWNNTLVSLREQFRAQSAQTYLWAAVFFATGVGLYFRIPIEPGYWPMWVFFGMGCVFAALSAGRPLLLVFSILVLGYGWAGVSAHGAAAPVLDKRMYGSVVGTVRSIDRSASEKPRLTLTDVVLDNLAPSRTPERVRIALHGPGPPPAIGERVRLIAHVSPPPGPAEPGGFDFQRHAWFLKLGGVGYSRKPAQVISPAKGMTMQILRGRISQWILSNLSDRSAGIGVAISTGDRRYLQSAVTDSLRQSNLAHLLAISGLHMGLLVGLIFGFCRFVLIWVPGVDARRVAACFALAGGAIYLFVSGASIATERAFVMAAVILLAVILRRRALTLRGIAVAVWIVLMLRPEAIFSPGFHMSFAATIALVLVFQATSEWAILRSPGPMRYLTSAVLSAGVAGFATAPFAAAHFNMIPHYGIVANVIAVPIMAMVVMPSLLIAIISSPFGIEWIPFAAMDWGIQTIIVVADYVSGWGGAVSFVKSPSPAVLPIFTIGIVFLILWHGWMRWAGGLVMVLAIVMWVQTPRPDILIADSGTLFSAMGPQGRVMSREKGSGFAARVWLENDGDQVSQMDAAQRDMPSWTQIKILRRWPEDGNPCDGRLIVVSAYVRDAPCDVFDLRRLRNTGSVAGFRKDGQIEWTTARGQSGRRLWNNRWLRRDAQTDRFWNRRIGRLPNQ